jgi:acyl-CoA thioester hydrolase
MIRYRINIEGRKFKTGAAMAAEVTYRGAVYPWHCDHVGHMNIMWYVGKFDEANWNLFARIGLTPSYLRDSGRGMAAVQQNISYKRELLAGDIVEIRSSLLDIGDKSIRFLHEMRNGETGEIAAICEITGVHMDRQARKSVAFTDAIRGQAVNYLGTAEAVMA